MCLLTGRAQPIYMIAECKLRQIHTPWYAVGRLFRQYPHGLAELTATFFAIAKKV